MATAKSVGKSFAGSGLFSTTRGCELVAEGADLKTLTINEVLANSPAAEAGLQEEDELIAIDGQPVTEFSLGQIRQMLKREGKEYALKLKRGSQMLQAKLKLRR